ncbi:hypothetical protein, partial [Chryseobacterium sp. G0240]|uniref:hypothetical protein n=1 Tax=Chryseobacterium sp. G0240 TaxID=2487066 RepID=UPI001E3FDAB8
LVMPIACVVINVSFFCFSVFLFLCLFFSLYHTAIPSYHQYSLPYPSCHPAGIQTKWTKGSQTGKTDKLTLQPVIFSTNPNFKFHIHLLPLFIIPFIYHFIGEFC